MSDLQGALIVLGVLAVGAVVIYNIWQERQFRRRSAQVLPDSGRDALLASGAAADRAGADAGTATGDAPDDVAEVRREPRIVAAGVDDQRIEPSLAPDRARVDDDAAVPTHEPRRGEPRSTISSALEGPSGLWYPIVFRLPAIADAAALAVIRSEVCGEARVSDWIAPDPSGDGTADGDADSAVDPREAADGATVDRVLRIQAVDATGPAGAGELQRMLVNAQRAAGQVGGQATAPDPGAAAEAAAGLHEFCNSVDVSIGLNVAAGGGGFVGTKLRGLIEAAGFRALPDNSYVLSDEAGNTLCTLTDGNGEGLDPQALRMQSVRAISLLLDVPRTPGALAQFERTATLARQFAQALSGSVVDDAGRVLDEASIARIRAQLASMVRAMRARGIEPGDALARRMFG